MEAGFLASLPAQELVFFINRGLLSGLIIGSVYALGAVGVTLIFGILRFAHFAHGDMMTIGAFVALVCVALFAGDGSILGLPAAFVLMPLAMAVTALLAIGVDRTFYAPLRRAKVRPVVIVMSSIGVMLMMQGQVPAKRRNSPCIISMTPVEDMTIKTRRTLARRSGA